MKSTKVIFLIAILMLSIIFAACGDENVELGTGDRGFCSSAKQAYLEGRTVDMFGNNPEITQEVATIKVSDQISIWVAEDNLDCVRVAPMYTKGNTFYFTGRETVYHIPNIENGYTENAMWDIYNMHYNINIKLYLFRGEKYSGNDTTGQKALSFNKETYTLVWKYTQDK